MLLSMLILCCSGQPVASIQQTRRHELSTNKVLSKRRVKHVESNGANKSVEARTSFESP
ncbi:hypothetical protein PSTT_11087 [Puccinia striiformis]|nr:hypothetical protein PSTT_11087 [Puccinia striiformis]